MLVLSRTSVDTEAWSRRYHFQVSQTCLPGAFCCWFGLRGSLWLPLSLPLASDQFFTLNSLLRTRIRSQAAMWVSYRPDQAWVALLLNIASSISCHKLAGVALARCLSRQVKNDPPTADRTAQLAGWAMGVLGRPIPRAPGAGGRYIGLEWAVASRCRPREGGSADSAAPPMAAADQIVIGTRCVARAGWLLFASASLPAAAALRSAAAFGSGPAPAIESQ